MNQMGSMTNDRKLGCEYQTNHKRYISSWSIYQTNHKRSITSWSIYQTKRDEDHELMAQRRELMAQGRELLSEDNMLDT